MARQSTMPRTITHYSDVEKREILKATSSLVPNDVVDYISSLSFAWLKELRLGISKLERGKPLFPK